MKTILKISLLSIICTFIFTAVSAQTVNKKTETFKVYGNCEMCKETIETALKKKDGILSKSWSPETKMITVTYDESKIKLADIKKKIADVGYDSDSVRASDAVYNGLHKCCRYDRPKK